jgi:membrane dipeptidase
LYPHHLRGGPRCTLDDFCGMVARLAERIGTHRIGIGSDLCQDQPDAVVEWMRNGRWMKAHLLGERPTFPPQPHWFRANRGFVNLRGGLRERGFSAEDVDQILGANWYNFFAAAFSVPTPGQTETVARLQLQRSQGSGGPAANPARDARMTP